MLALIIVLIILIVIFMFSFRGVKKKKAKLIHSLSQDDFCLSVRTLAMSMRHAEQGGIGVSYKEIIEPIRDAVKKINKKMLDDEEIFEFEKWIFENYYLVDGILSKGKIYAMEKMPHVDNVPRILSLARFIVDNSCTALTVERISEAIEIFNSATPLYFEELDFLKEAIFVALCENISLLSKKSLQYGEMKNRAKKDTFYKRYATSDSYIMYYNQNHRDIVDKENLYGRAEYGYGKSLEQNRALAEYCINGIRQVSEGLNRRVIYELSYIYQKMRKETCLDEMDDESKYQIMTKIKKITAKTNVSEKYFCEIMSEILKLNEVDFTTLLFDCESGVINCIKKGKGEVIKPRAGEVREKLIIAFNVLSALFGGVITAIGVYLPMATAKTGLGTGYNKDVGLLESLIRLFVTPIARGLMTAADYVFLTFVVILFSLLLYPKVSHLFNMFFHNFLRKGFHFSMDYKVIAKENTLLVAKAVFCTTIEDFDDSLAKLLELKSVNNYENCYYSLLIDTPKSTEQISDIDKLLIGAMAKLKDKNEYSGINLFLRKKTLINGKYLPYERKRGAINALNSYLTAKKDEMIFTLNESMPKPTFVCLLDDDNTVINGGMLTLVNNMLHPYNLKFDLMAMKCKYNMYSQKSNYAKKYKSSSGIEKYPQYADTQFALTKKANYCGKGIYRLSPYTQKLEGKFRDNSVLSHDIIEGAMLNTGLAEVIAYEESPNTLMAEIERQKRWNRGDALLLGFVGRRHRNTAGRLIKNNISSVYKDIIIKNNLIMLEPFIATIILALCVITANVGLIFSLIYTLFLVQIIDILAIIRLWRKNIFSFNCSKIYGLMKDRVDEILLMPYNCLQNISIYAVTLYKLLFKREKLLEWKTFKSSQKSVGYKKLFLTFIPSWILLAIFTAIFFTPAMLIYSMLSVGRVNCLYVAGKIRVKRDVPSTLQKENLLKISKATSEFMFDATNKDTALVSDNIQRYPKMDCYNMTSPTNIGFSILNIISSVSIGIITAEEADKKLNEVINTVEKLKKWRGCLYNWYDIYTLKISNSFISSVDEGNFLAALITLCGYLKSRGNEDSLSLRERVIKIIDASETDALFDEGRKLFYIGVNVGSGVNFGHYDLFSSESLILSYISILLSRVTTAHWFTLSRAATNIYGNTMLSWSGTMFEYLLPHLFFDTKKPTLLYRTAKNVTKAQRKNVFGGLYGVSECAYGKMDSSLRYQYYAFGINELSLCNEPTSPIVSPYSSFLALAFDKKYYSNIDGLMRDGYNEKFGFYDSMSMANGRRIIYSHFAHHQGMIITSIANILTDGVIKKYFSDYKGQSITQLLLTEERDMSRVSRPVKLRVNRDKGKDGYSMAKSLEKIGCKYNFHISAELNGVIDENGNGYFVDKSVFLNRYRFADIGYGGGYFYVKDNATDILWSPTNAPLFSGDKHSIRFEKGMSEFKNESKKTSLTIRIAPHLKMIIKNITIENNTLEEKKITLYYYEEVAMNHYGEDVSHRCFQNLFVRTDFVENESLMYAVRKNMHDAKGYYYGVKVVGCDIVPEGNRFNFIGRNRTEKAPSFIISGLKTENSLGDTLEPCLAFSADILLPPNSIKEVICAICVADSLEELIEVSNKAKDDSFIKTVEQLDKIKSSFTDVPVIKEDVYEILNKVFYLLNHNNLRHCDDVSTMGNRDNVNGEARLFVLDYHKTRTPDAVNIINAFGILQRLNVPIELYILFGEEKGKADLSEQSIRQIIEKYNCRGILTTRSAFAMSVAHAIAYDVKNLETLNVLLENYPKPLVKIKDGLIKIAKNELVKIVERYGDELRGDEQLVTGEGEFLDGKNYAVEPFGEDTLLPYSNVCAKKSFGFVTTENGGGFTFFKNSQLEKMTEWYNDPVKDTKSEDVFLIIDDSVLLLSDINGGKTSVVHGMYKTLFVTKTDKFTVETELSLSAIGEGKDIKVTINNYSGEKLECRLCLGLFLSLGKYKGYYYDKKDCGERAYVCNVTNGIYGYVRCSKVKKYTINSNTTDGNCLRHSTEDNIKTDGNYLGYIAEENCQTDENSIRYNAEENIKADGNNLGYNAEENCQTDENYLRHSAEENIKADGNYLRYSAKENFQNAVIDDGKYNHKFIFNKYSLYTGEGERTFVEKPPCADNFIGVVCGIELDASCGMEQLFTLEDGEKGKQEKSACTKNGNDEKNTSETNNTSRKNGIDEKNISGENSSRGKNSSKKNNINRNEVSFAPSLDDKTNIYIKTNNKAFDIMFNYRLPYQIKSSRLSAKAGYYQAGGAIGFRDQLQDCLGILYVDSAYVRGHILKCCEHQYAEGDVQHWWHEGLMGVRTRITDDKVFLAYVTSMYILATGDEGILSEKVDFLLSNPLADAEKSRMETPQKGKADTVYEHITRAIDSARRYGKNDLILIGGGDWNDALDEIGDKNNGESVWLTAFLFMTINAFLPYAKNQEIRRWSGDIGRLKKSINEKGFNGSYFNRAITRDGETLGSPDSLFCKIDLITQATAVLAKISSTDRLEGAMAAAESLVDRENKLVKLLAPPFNESKYYGYISSYPQGVRENGGQYTHGAAWYIIALCELGQKSKALDIYNMINPVEKCQDIRMTQKYKGEPYVFSADVYSADGNEGRCGWTFYTGSASWLYRCVFEHILGIRLVRGCLEFDFVLPKVLDGCEVFYKSIDNEYHIKMQISDKQGLFINGVEYVGDNKINLSDGAVISEVLVKCKEN